MNAKLHARYANHTSEREGDEMQLNGIVTQTYLLGGSHRIKIENGDETGAAFQGGLNSVIFMLIAPNPDGLQLGQQVRILVQGEPLEGESNATSASS